MDDSSESFFSLPSNTQQSRRDQDAVEFTAGLPSDDIEDLINWTPEAGDMEASQSSYHSFSQSTAPLQNVPPAGGGRAGTAAGGERARKRRRLNNGSSSRPGVSRETSIDLTSNLSGPGFIPRTGVPVSALLRDDSIESNGTRPAERDAAGSRPSSSLSWQERPFATHVTDDAGLTAGGAQPGGEPSLQSHLETNDEGPSLLDTIDLTDVTDFSSMRQREQLDEEERQARREASMKMEARKAANERMLKSTLKDQLAETNMDETSQKGIGAMQCVICMDSFTDLTATHCGHLFCHTCINEHLITAEMTAVHRSALCPFCRQPVHRKPTRSKDKDKTIVPLSFKVRPKEKPVQGKGKQREVERPD